MKKIITEETLKTLIKEAALKTLYTLLLETAQTEEWDKLGSKIKSATDLASNISFKKDFSVNPYDGSNISIEKYKDGYIKIVKKKSPYDFFFMNKTNGSIAIPVSNDFPETKRRHNGIKYLYLKANKAVNGAFRRYTYVPSEAKDIIRVNETNKNEYDKLPNNLNRVQQNQNIIAIDNRGNMNPEIQNGDQRPQNQKTGTTNNIGNNAQSSGNTRGNTPSPNNMVNNAQPSNNAVNNAENTTTKQYKDNSMQDMIDNLSLFQQARDYVKNNNPFYNYNRVNLNDYLKGKDKSTAYSNSALHIQFGNSKMALTPGKRYTEKNIPHSYYANLRNIMFDITNDNLNNIYIIPQSSGISLNKQPLNIRTKNKIKKGDTLVFNGLNYKLF